MWNPRRDTEVFGEVFVCLSLRFITTIYTYFREHSTCVVCVYLISLMFLSFYTWEFGKAMQHGRHRPKTKRNTTTKHRDEDRFQKGRWKDTMQGFSRLKERTGWRKRKHDRRQRNLWYRLCTFITVRTQISSATATQTLLQPTAWESHHTSQPLLDYD